MTPNCVSEEKQDVVKYDRKKEQFFKIYNKASTEDLARKIKNI